MGPETGTALCIRVHAGTDAPARAREAIRSLDDPGWILGDAMLVASELVSYALTRADPAEAEPIELRLDREVERVVVRVSWASDPRDREPDVTRAGGDLYARLGLHIVGVLAERHEILTGGAWAELRRPSPGGD